MSERTLKPWESGSIPVTGDSGKVRPAPVQFEDVELDFDEDSIEYADPSPPPPLDDEDVIPDDDPFEGTHTNVTNVKELQKWLEGVGPPPSLASAEKEAAFDPEATSLVSGVDMGALLQAAQRTTSQEQPPESSQPPQAPQAPPAADSAFTVSGSLEAFQLGELLQLFATSRRTGSLTLSHGGEIGKLYMNMGDVYAATWNEVAPDDPSDALRRMAKMKQGEFNFGPLQGSQPAANVNMSLPQLLILMLADDDELGSGDLALDAPLTLPEPMMEPLRALSPEELDVLQLMHNYKTLEAAMPQAGALDPDRLQEIVMSLLERGYLRKLEFLDNEDDFFGGAMF